MLCTQLESAGGDKTEQPRALNGLTIANGILGIVTVLLLFFSMAAWIVLSAIALAKRKQLK